MTNKTAPKPGKSRALRIVMWVFLAAYAGIFLKTAPVIFEWLFPHAVAVQAAASPLPVQKDIKSLTFVTYNVLDNPIAVEKRMPVLFGILRDSHADVIALQELDGWSLDMLLKEPWVAGYYRVDGTQECGGQYILSKMPVDHAMCYPLPGAQGRTALLATIRIDGRALGVATSHMESHLEDGATRGRQLDLIFEKLAIDDDAVFLGDLNCGDGEKENSHIPSAYTDLWKSLRPQEPGYTWDNEKSDMAGKSDERFPGEPSRRLDRIVIRSGVWAPKETRLIGDQPVAPGRKELFPSDHFGLFGSVQKSGS